MKTDDPALRRLALLISALVLVLLILSAVMLSLLDKPVAATVWQNLFPVVVGAISGLTAWALSQQRKG